MIEVGENSYITLEEANDYIAGAVDGESWELLKPTQQRRCLLTAASNIDQLLFVGRKKEPYQSMQFPRNPFAGVPTSIKIAQALEALALSDPQAAKRRKLQEQGVSSINLGKASESYTDRPDNGGLVSAQAYAQLRPWIAGSVGIV